VRPVADPAIRYQAFVFNEKKIIYFKLPEVVAMGYIVIKVKHYPRLGIGDVP
jgi:hypothetical protein